MLYINLGTVNAMYQYETTKSRIELQDVALKFNIHHTDSNAKQIRNHYNLVLQCSAWLLNCI